MATLAQAAPLSGAGPRATAISRKLRAAAMQGNQSRIKLLLTTLLEHPARRSDEWLPYQLGVLEEFSMTLHTLAFVDELTGLFNRRGFMRSATRQLAQLRACGQRALLFYADVDNLKQTNDTLGHQAGDALLRETAAVLRGSFRACDAMGRLGGDEFAVLAADQSPEDGALIIERVAEAVAACNGARQDAPLSLSVGYVQYAPTDPRPLAELLRAADSVMYGRKLSKLLVMDPELRCRPTV
ncbi:MAG: GGDEF domain-containing protein [Gammaproteobacteria bacterium]|nr:GGDEF domain-containing protein [Gammaproteobacteria bacterium]